MRRQDRLAVAADPRRRRRAGHAHPLHELDAVDALTSKRRAAARAELPEATAPASRRRKSWERAAAIVSLVVEQDSRIRLVDSAQEEVL